jgi:hypothetical protein
MSNIDTDRIAALLSPQHDAHTRRSEAARLADFIDQIDAAIARGVPRQEVLARLHEGGFTMSLRTFDKALHRIRKRLGRTAPRGRAVRPAEPPQTLPSEALKGAPVAMPAPAPHASTPSSSSPRAGPLGAGIRTLDELAAENPHLSRMQLIKLEAQQYDQPLLSSSGLDEIARKYGEPPRR